MKNINMFVYKNECYTVPKKYFIKHTLTNIENKNIQRELYFCDITVQLVTNIRNFFNENNVLYNPVELTDYIITHCDTLIECFSDFEV